MAGEAVKKGTKVRLAGNGVEATLYVAGRSPKFMAILEGAVGRVEEERCCGMRLVAWNAGDATYGVRCLSWVNVSALVVMEE